LSTLNIFYKGIQSTNKITYNIFEQKSMTQVNDFSLTDFNFEHGL